MTRSEARTIGRNYVILDSEIESSIEFVRDLLERQADELKKTEPYAVNTIRDLEKAAYIVHCLLDTIEDE